MEFLLTLGNILLFLIVLSIIIVIHELGHFWFAKRAGILVHEFSLGMGPALYQKKKGTTNYAIRAIPLGGYVAMSGENGPNDAFIKKGQTIGLQLDELESVSFVVLDQTNHQPDVVGQVLDFDLYGENFDPLFIVLNVDDKAVKYLVNRDAKYIFRKNQRIQITPSESSFANKTLWQRFLVLFAGPAMNFLLALLILFTVAIIQGKPQNTPVVGASAREELQSGDVITHLDGNTITTFDDVGSIMNGYESTQITVGYERAGVAGVATVDLQIILQNFGFTNRIGENNVIVGQVFAKAQQAGLQTGDLITAISYTGLAHTSPTWTDIIRLSRMADEGEISITYIRGDAAAQTITYDVMERSVIESLGAQTTILQIGIGRTYGFDFVHMLTYPFTQFWSSVAEMGTTLLLLINPSVNVGISDLAGPVGIFSLVSNAASAGFVALLGFVAFLSVNIGLINLLPIPALDGGRLLFLGYEAVTRKKVPAKFEAIVNNVAFLLLMLLFVFVTWNDILRLGR